MFFNVAILLLKFTILTYADPSTPANTLFNINNSNPSFSDRIISNSLQSLFPQKHDKINEALSTPTPIAPTGQDNNNATEDEDENSSPDSAGDDEIQDSSEKSDNELIRPKKVEQSSDLSPLTEFRHFFRRTVDGRLCAAAFIQDDQTYTDCTNATAPDGSSGKKWCYVEVQLINKGLPLKDWAECEPPRDYDRIRLAVSDKILEKLELAKQMSSEIELHTNRLERFIKKFTSWDLNYKHFAKTMETISELFQKCTEKLNMVKDIRNNITINLKKIESFECKIHEAVSASKSTALNCHRDSSHTIKGIEGTYYYGRGFNTTPLSKRLDRNINFHFFGPPIEGLSPFVFSIKWNGYIEAPHTGHFLFKLTSNGHAKLLLEDKVLIELLPGILATEFKHRVLSHEYGLDLVGGNVYPIEVIFIHDHRYHHSHSNEAIISLFWESTNIPMQPVPHRAFINNVAGEKLKLTILDGENFQIAPAENGVKVTMHDSRYHLVDVPQSLIGHKLIRMNLVDKLILNIKVNIPAVLYVVHKGAFPITTSINDKINAIGSNLHINYFDNNDVVKMKLTGMVLLPGKIHELTIINGATDLKEDIVPPVMICRSLHGSEFHPHTNATLCGPDEILSMPGGRFFGNCSSSSHEEDFDCEAGFSNKNRDTSFSMWHSAQHKGIGEYSEIYFKKLVQVRKLIFKPRDDPLTWPLKIILNFKPENVNDPTEEPAVFRISHTSDEEFHHYELINPVITNYARIEVASMYLQDMETGGSFTLIGGSCHEDPHDTHYDVDRIVEVENCTDSAESVAGFPWNAGTEIMIVCPKCENNKDIALKRSKDPSVDYSIDSPPCIAAKPFCSKDDSECRALMILGSDGFSVMKPHPLHEESKPINIVFGAKGQGLSPIDAATVLPKGYYADQGQMKTKINDLTYGWLEEAEFDTCNEKDNNVLLKYGIKFPKANEGWECLVKEKCRGNYWSIDLKNRTYRVTVYLGSKCDTDTQEICLNMNHAISIHEFVPSKSIYKYTGDIKITNNTLILSSYCKDSARQTTIQSITLVPH